jgi:enamine deaminase RidA (YjgF/YER057c/UK114 family)
MVQLAQAGGTAAAAPASAPTVKSVGRLAGSADSFAYAVKAGPWIFLNGHEAYDFERGLAPEVEGPPGHRLSGRPPLRREAEYILRRMRAILKEFGSDLPNAVRVDQFYTTGQAVHAYHLARFSEFGSYIPPSTSIIMEYFRDIPCAVTLVPAMDYSSIESMLEINLIALKNGAARRKQVVEVDVPALASYGPCVRAGELVFPSGLMALSRDGRVPAADDAAAFDAIGLAGQAQGALIHSYAEAVCKAVGVPMGNVVRAQYFLTDIRDFAGVAAAWSDRYGKQPHPFATVQVPGPLPSSGAAVIGDFWIYAG